MELDEWVEKVSTLNITVTLDDILRGLDRDKYKSYFNLKPRDRVRVNMALRHRFADELYAKYMLCYLYKGEFQSPYAKLRYTGATQVPDFNLDFGSKPRPDPEKATLQQINYLIIRASAYDLPRFHLNKDGVICTPSGHVILKVEASALLDAINKDGTLPDWADDYRSIELNLP